MMERILHELKKFDEAEHAFGEEFLNNIAYGITADAYVAKVYDYPAIALKKENCFEQNYFDLIYYLTDMKNRHMNGCEPHHESSYYHDWLTFKRNYNIRKAWFYLSIQDPDDENEVVDLFIEILGRINYRALTTLLNTLNEDYKDHAHNVMEYIGNTRAIRDLNMRYLDSKFGTQWQFHLWHMMPTTITEDYGYIFYLGNELSKLDYCPYDYQAKEYYYKEFYRTLYNNMNKDIPINEHITEKQKLEIWKEISREVLDYGEDYDDFDDLDDLDEFDNLDDLDEFDEA